MLYSALLKIKTVHSVVIVVKGISRRLRLRFRFRHEFGLSKLAKFALHRLAQLWRVIEEAKRHGNMKGEKKTKKQTKNKKADRMWALMFLKHIIKSRTSRTKNKQEICVHWHERLLLSRRLLRLAAPACLLPLHLAPAPSTHPETLHINRRKERN